ncbi:hypothetical protein L249_8003 [Ophiocordyceps polyrhachis-furcata BCC 54312]|uniref:Uncharacterized protein n=1 Tax=Ophiocordyceps polyrhachis-furcata BCC 54312 TaxID=1330021 RepID=A0A367LH96_9HYPO|nr:hypothetical protein L249_8003 [Ophiocordyceps polyrhachis-furcata BCC 54312]
MTVHLLWSSPYICNIHTHPPLVISLSPFLIPPRPTITNHIDIMVRPRPLYLSLLATAATVTAADEKAANQTNATDSDVPTLSQLGCLASLLPPALPLPTMPAELESLIRSDGSCVPSSLSSDAENLRSQMIHYSTYVQAHTKTCSIPASLSADFDFLSTLDFSKNEVTVCPSGDEKATTVKTSSSSAASASATSVTSSPSASQKGSGKPTNSSSTASKTSGSAAASNTSDKSSNAAALKAGFAVAAAAAGLAVLAL